LVHPGIISLAQMAKLFSVNPARILKLPHGTLTPGAAAHITLIYPELQSEVRSAEFLSRSRNTPFEGWKLRGGPAATIVGGNVVWSLL
jgi:dihydroorotase